MWGLTDLLHKQSRKGINEKKNSVKFSKPVLRASSTNLPLDFVAKLLRLSLIGSGKSEVTWGFTIPPSSNAMKTSEMRQKGMQIISYKSSSRSKLNSLLLSCSFSCLVVRNFSHTDLGREWESFRFKAIKLRVLLMMNFMLDQWAS